MGDVLAHRAVDLDLRVNALNYENFHWIKRGRTLSDVHHSTCRPLLCKTLYRVLALEDMT